MAPGMVKTISENSVMADLAHRYFFKLYALDTVINLESGITKAQLLAAVEGHLLDEGQLMGKYKR